MIDRSKSHKLKSSSQQQHNINIQWLLFQLASSIYILLLATTFYYYYLTIIIILFDDDDLD